MEAVKNYILANHSDLFSSVDNLVIQELQDSYLVEVGGEQPPLVIMKTDI